MTPFEKFRAWHLCHELTLAVYASTRRWPANERFGLTPQIRRAAVSASANLAEGSAKRGSREFRRFIDISIGSLLEVAYFLRLARDLEYISNDEWLTLDSLRFRAGRSTWMLYSRVAAAAGKPGS